MGAGAVSCAHDSCRGCQGRRGGGGGGRDGHGERDGCVVDSQLRRLKFEAHQAVTIAEERDGGWLTRQPPEDIGLVLNLLVEQLRPGAVDELLERGELASGAVVRHKRLPHIVVRAD